MKPSEYSMIFDHLDLLIKDGITRTRDVRGNINKKEVYEILSSILWNMSSFLNKMELTTSLNKTPKTLCPDKCSHAWCIKYLENLR